MGRLMRLGHFREPPLRLGLSHGCAHARHYDRNDLLGCLSPNRRGLMHGSRLSWSPYSIHSKGGHHIHQARPKWAATILYRRGLQTADADFHSSAASALQHHAELEPAAGMLFGGAPHIASSADNTGDLTVGDLLKSPCRIVQAPPDTGLERRGTALPSAV